jgi:formylglycine-generating enzyme required for sulfatase activity
MQGKAMFVLSQKNRAKTSSAHSTIFLILIVWIVSCGPQMPVTPAEQLKSDVPLYTPTLGIINTQLSVQDGMDTVLVSADTFEMGGEFGPPASFPVHTVYLDDFWIDKTEITNEMFAKFDQNTDCVTNAERRESSLYFCTENQTVIWEGVSGLDSPGSILLWL